MTQALGKTSWTWEQVRALERAVDAHIVNCEARLALDAPPGEDCGPIGCCPIGESLMETWASAEVEYSWQPDFPKPDDPRWTEREGRS